MKKIKKEKSSRHVRLIVPAPERMDMDVLSYLNDDDLLRRLDFLLTEKDRAAAAEADTLRPWEVEVCYVQRELRIRSARRAAHERWVALNFPQFDRGDAIGQQVAAVN